MRILYVKFPGSQCPLAFDAQDIEVEEGATVVVEGQRGSYLATVATLAEEREDVPNADQMPKVLRHAEDEDLIKQQQYRSREDEAKAICLSRIRARNLDMKLVRTEYIFDGSKAIFFFTADGRVDFRELVRDLARELKTRIEMVQIGVRDEAKMMGGLGICGREFCCSSFMNDFFPVSIKMAKDQCLSLNPSKVSGGCGRLLCCLSYEHQSYLEFRRGLPKVGKRCMCPHGPGKISRYDIVKQKVVVILEDGREVEVEREDIAKLPPQN